MTTLDKLNEALDKLNDVKDTYSFCEISDENENNTLEHLDMTEENVLQIADEIIDVLVLIVERRKELANENTSK